MWSGPAEQPQRVGLQRDKGAEMLPQNDAERKGSRQAVRLVATGHSWLLLACPVAVIWEGRQRATAQSSPESKGEKEREENLQELSGSLHNEV